MTTPNTTVPHWGRIFQSSKINSLFSINSESRRPVDRVGSTPTHLNLLPQESFNHLKDGYLRDSWEDVFSSCEGSTEKLLADHFLKDGSQLGEDVPGQ